MTKPVWAVAVLGLTIAGGALRFANLGRLGIIGHDEAVYLLETRYILERRGEERPVMAKPVHLALLALASGVLGWSDRAGLSVSALAGTATIPVVAAIGRHAFGAPAGWFAALGLAVSAFHIRYSRTAGPDVVATMFLSLTVWAVLKMRRARRPAGWMAAVGAGAALSIMTHFRMLWAVLGLALWTGGVVLRRPPGWAVLRRRAVAFVAGGAVPWLAVEVWYGWLRATGPGPAAYVRQLYRRLAMYPAGGLWTFNEPWAQARYLIAEDGLFAVALAVAGALWLLRDAFVTGDEEKAGVMGWGVVPLVFWSVYIYYPGAALYPRSLVMAMPALAALAGCGAARLAALAGRWPAAAALGLSGLLLLAGLPRAFAETQVRGGYREAALAVAQDAARRGRAARVHWVHGPVWRLYVMQVAPQVGRPADALLEVVQTTAPPIFYNYAIVDPYVYSLDPDTQARLDRLMRVARPLGAWPNTWANDPTRLRDMGEVLHRLAEAGLPRDLGLLKVYRWPG